MPGNERKVSRMRRVETSYWAMRNRLFSVVVSVAGTALSCAPGSGPGASVPGPGGEENCEKFGTVAVNGKQYVVQNNEWNSGATQCIDAKGTAFTVTQGQFDIATNGPPATYPAIFKGCHWGNCTEESGMPVQVAKLPAVTSSWSVAVPAAGGAYDVAYDIWFNRSPSTTGQPDGTELMIWLDHGGGVQPAGAKVATVDLAGSTWDLWMGKMESWKYVAYVRQPATSKVDNLDIRAFTLDSVKRGYVDPSNYLIAIEAGFEIWKGGPGFATNAFSAAVGSQ
jgi:hypothetical protein